MDKVCIHGYIHDARFMESIALCVAWENERDVDCLLHNQGLEIIMTSL